MLGRILRRCSDDSRDSSARRFLRLLPPYWTTSVLDTAHSVVLLLAFGSAALSRMLFTADTCGQCEVSVEGGVDVVADARRGSMPLVSPVVHATFRQRRTRHHMPGSFGVLT